MKKSKGWRWAFIVMAALGLLILLACAAIELYGAITGKDIEIPHTVYYVAGVIGFVGFFKLSPDESLLGGNFIITAAERVIVAVRTGRRKSDAVVIVPDATTVEVQSAPADLPETKDHEDTGSKKTAPRDQLHEEGE